MPATDKVGSWLGNSGPKGKTAEAYDSDSATSKATSVGDAASDVSDDEDDVQAVEDEGTRQVNIDWESVMPKVRVALLDPSPKRRDQFIERYLYVTEECTLAAGSSTDDSSCRCPDRSAAAVIAIGLDAIERYEAN